MSEFTRKKRYYNYHHPLCKKYLRIDFDYKCAYCGASEAEFITGHNAFEIDHFMPQSYPEKGLEINKYPNLYYSCEICNGVTGKSDKWSPYLLDPCKFNIYGQGNHILFGDDTNDHKLIPLTMEGAFFIESINLNQQKQRIVRKKRCLYLKNNQEQEKEIQRLKRNIDKMSMKIEGDFDKELIEIRTFMSEQLKRIEEARSGAYNFNEILMHELFDHKYEVDFESTIQGYLQLKKVYEDYDLDYESILENGNLAKFSIRFYETIKFNSGIKRIRISKEQAIDWMENITNSRIGLCILLFNFVDRKIYFSSFNKFSEASDITKYNLFVSIPVYEINELSDVTFESFCTSLTDVLSGEPGAV